MTTTVTVKTHARPASVTANSDISHSTNEERVGGYRTVTSFVPAHSERAFTVTDTQSVYVSELAEGATGLDQPFSEGGTPTSAG